MAAEENHCDAANDQNKSTFLFSVLLGGLFISIDHTIKSKSIKIPNLIHWDGKNLYLFNLAMVL